LRASEHLYIVYYYSIFHIKILTIYYDLINPSVYMKNTNTIPIKANTWQQHARACARSFSAGQKIS